MLGIVHDAANGECRYRPPIGVSHFAFLVEGWGMMELSELMAGAARLRLLFN